MGIPTFPRPPRETGSCTSGAPFTFDRCFLYSAARKGVARMRAVRTHKQVWVKVNAHVDKAIAPLVESLSRFDHVRTSESCEGNDETVPARVWFSVGIDGCGSTVAFMQWLAPKLMARVGDDAYCSLEWGTRTMPLGLIETRRGRVPTVSRALSRLAAEWNLRPSSCRGHNSASVRGTECRAPRSSKQHTRRQRPSDEPGSHHAQ